MFYVSPPGSARSKVTSTDASLEREAHKPVAVPRTETRTRRRLWYVGLAVIAVVIALVVYLAIAR